MTIFGKLPIELIELVLSYDGLYKLRNCMFMKQISKDDLRYGLFDTIPKPKISIGNCCTFIYIDFNPPYYTRSIKIIHFFYQIPFLYQYSKLLHDDLEEKDCLTIGL